MNYSAAAAKASKQIKAKGSRMTLRVVTPGAFDAATGTYGTSTTTDYTAYGVMLSARSNGAPGQFDNQPVNGGSIYDRKRIIIMEAVGLTRLPLAGDQVLVGSATWIVKGSTVLSPDATTNILYKVEVEQ